MLHSSKPKKVQRESLMDSSYKQDEAQRSGQIGLKVWERYQSNRGLKFLFERSHRKIIETIKSDDKLELKKSRLLEIGCGMGDFLKEVENIIGHIYGVDISEEMVSVARENLSANAHILSSDGEQLPFEDSFFDFVLMKGVVHHLGKPTLVFKEAARVLRKHGKLIIFEGNPASYYRTAVLKIADLMKIEHETSFFPHLNAEQISDLLSKCDLQPETKKISGLFAPFGLSGLGGQRIWHILNPIEDFLEKYLPFFSWYNLIVATRL